MPSLGEERLEPIQAIPEPRGTTMTDITATLPILWRSRPSPGRLSSSSATRLQSKIYLGKNILKNHCMETSINYSGWIIQQKCLLFCSTVNWLWVCNFADPAWACKLEVWRQAIRGQPASLPDTTHYHVYCSPPLRKHPVTFPLWPCDIRMSLTVETWSPHYRHNQAL